MAISAGWTWFIFIMAIIIGGLALWYYLLKIFDKGKDEETTHDINLCDLKEGRAYGKEVDVKQGPNGRTVRYIVPQDINVIKWKKQGKPKITPVPVVVDRGKTLQFPKGAWSKDKNINLLLPANAVDLPDDFKETMFGKFMMFYIELINANNTEIDALKEGFDRQAQYITEMGHGEASVKHITMLNEIFKDGLEMAKEGKRDKAPTTFTPPGSSYDSQS